MEKKLIVTEELIFKLIIPLETDIMRVLRVNTSTLSPLFAIYLIPLRFFV